MLKVTNTLSRDHNSQNNIRLIKAVLTTRRMQSTLSGERIWFCQAIVLIDSILMELNRVGTLFLVILVMGHLDVLSNVYSRCKSLKKINTTQ